MPCAAGSSSYTYFIKQMHYENRKMKISRDSEGVVGVTGYQIYQKYVLINVYDVSKPIGVDWEHVFMKKSSKMNKSPLYLRFKCKTTF